MLRHRIQIFLKFGHGFVEGRVEPGRLVTSSIVIVVSIFMVDCHVQHVSTITGRRGFHGERHWHWGH